MSSAADIKRLNAVLAKVLDGMKPPEDVTVTEWAEKHRKLSSESSAEDSNALCDLVSAVNCALAPCALISGVPPRSGKFGTKKSFAPVSYRARIDFVMLPTTT